MRMGKCEIMEIKKDIRMHRALFSLHVLQHGLFFLYLDAFTCHVFPNKVI